MRVHDLLETANSKVTFEYRDDSEGNKNRGWQVDKVDALLDDNVVGYLKMSYIPRQRFEQFYPGIMNYLSQVGGNGVLPHDYRTTPWQDIPPGELKKQVYSVCQVARTSWNESNRLQQQANEVWSDAEVMKFFADMEKVLNKEFGWKFKRFESYYVDKPIVDYIKVKDDYKRQGIGTALYRAGYKWMKEKGMTLYASGTQSDAAKATWKTLQKQYDVKRTRSMNPFAKHARQTRRYFA